MEDKNNIGLSNLKPAAGSKRTRKILGRGPGSGRGGTSTKGHKGQNSRSGGRRHPRFEGGQMPIQRRLPKRGFKNFFRESYQVINVKDIERFESYLTEDRLKSNISSNKKTKRLCILGYGEINKAFTVHASRFSKSAIEKIEKAGGKAVLVQ